MRFRKNGESQNYLGRLDNTSDRLPVLIRHRSHHKIIESNSRSDSKTLGHCRGPTSEIVLDPEFLVSVLQISNQRAWSRHTSGAFSISVLL